MRLLFVHAHPDDESLWTGVAMAHHVAAGDEVHVLTCTLGEEGEVIPHDLKHLELPAGQERDESAEDPLANVRREELRAAMRAMGVTSSVVLGDEDFVSQAGAQYDRRYRDSGMAGTPSASHPRAFTAGVVSEQADAVAAYIDALHPDIVVTYDEHGGYGHPDHIRTHDVTVAAVGRSATNPTLYITLTPQSWAEEDRAWLASPKAQDVVARHGYLVLSHDDPYPPSVVADDDVTHAVIDEQTRPRQAAALDAHRTQVSVDGEVYALSNEVAARLSGREGYARYDANTHQRIRAVSPSGRLSSGDREELTNS